MPYGRSWLVTKFDIDVLTMSHGLDLIQGSWCYRTHLTFFSFIRRSKQLLAVTSLVFIAFDFLASNADLLLGGAGEV